MSDRFKSIIQNSIQARKVKIHDDREAKEQAEFDRNEKIRIKMDLLKEKFEDQCKQARKSFLADRYALEFIFDQNGNNPRLQLEFLDPKRQSTYGRPPIVTRYISRVGDKFVYSGRGLSDIESDLPVVDNQGDFFENCIKEMFASYLSKAMT